MRAIQITERVDSPSKLWPSDIAQPRPSSEQVRVQIHAAAANFFDGLQIRGRYQVKPKLPYVLGAEFAGQITEVGTQVKRWKVGDRVFGSAQGSFAQYVCAEEGMCLPVPSGWSYEAACGLFVTAPTSYCGLVTRANVQRGETVLVHAAAGGVSLAAVQIAKACGARIIATASTPEKLHIAARYGADHVVNYREEDWVAQVNALGGADVIYDPVGEIEKDMRVVKWNGRILVIGFAGGNIPNPPLNRVLLKNCSIVGVHWGAYSKNEKEMIPVIWRTLFELIAQGKFRPTTYKVLYGLSDVGKALDALESRRTWGKVTIKIDHPSPKL